jgi:hypothetical protein
VLEKCLEREIKGSELVCSCSSENANELRVLMYAVTFYENQG